jgi:hypothetical protein
MDRPPCTQKTTSTWLESRPTLADPGHTKASCLTSAALEAVQPSLALQPKHASSLMQLPDRCRRHSLRSSGRESRATATPVHPPAYLLSAVTHGHAHRRNKHQRGPSNRALTRKIPDLGATLPGPPSCTGTSQPGPAVHPSICIRPSDTRSHSMRAGPMQEGPASQMQRGGRQIGGKRA